MKILISGLLVFALQTYAVEPDCPASMNSVPLEQDVAEFMIEVLQRSDFGSLKKLDIKDLFISVTQPYRKTSESRSRVFGLFEAIGFTPSDYRAVRNVKLKGHDSALERLNRGWRTLSQIVGVPDNRIITRGQVNAVHIALLNARDRH